MQINTIIDYCLASSECQIPIDTIRDNLTWYGLLLETEAEQLLLARKGPEGREASDSFFLMRGETVSIPPAITLPNEKADGVKHIMNYLAGTPYVRLSGADDRPYQERLDFRDLMALVFQSQEVVANQNILFYKTHAHEHRERLKNWLPYILGAETLSSLFGNQEAIRILAQPCRSTATARPRRARLRVTILRGQWRLGCLGNSAASGTPATALALNVFDGEAVLLHQRADLINDARHFSFADFCELSFQGFLLGQELLVSCHAVVRL